MTPLGFHLGDRGMPFRFKDKGWTNPYITDGLVAMWDGEWNVAGGVHDSNAMAWTDLVSGTKCAYSQTDIPYWEDKAWRSVASDDNKYFLAYWPDGLRYAHTIEIIAKKDGTGKGIFFGSYGISVAGNNYVSIEWDTSKAVRAFYNSIPTILGSSNSFPLDTTVYTAVLHFDNTYNIVGPHGDVLGSSTKTEHRLTKTDIAYIGADARANLRFFGRIFAIRMYNRALSTDEISKNFEIDKMRFGI